MLSDHNNLIEDENTLKTNKMIKWSVSVAVCAAIIIGGIIYGNHYDDKPINPSDNKVTPAKPNSFTIMAMASELKENEPFIMKGVDARSGVSITQSSNHHGQLEYTIHLPFICEGENIETVTYQVNTGTFQLLGNPDSIDIVAGTEYDGPEITSAYWPNDFNADNFENEFGAPPFEASYYTEYTVAYDKQQNNDLIIAVAGFGKIDAPSRIRMKNDRNTRANAYNELVGTITITCTANYQDGSSESQNIRVTAVPVEEENEELIPVYIGFVLE